MYNKHGLCISIYNNTHEVMYLHVHVLVHVPCTYIGVLHFKTVFCTFCTQTITNTDYIPLLSFIHYLYIQCIHIHVHVHVHIHVHVHVYDTGIHVCQ